MPITRHEPSKIYSKVVEANGFVFTAGIVAEKLDEDVKGQTRQVLAEIDRLLAIAATSRANVVSATIWLPDVRSRDAMNDVWSAWTGGQDLPAAPASRPSSPIRACWSRSPSSRRNSALAPQRPVFLEIGRGAPHVGASARRLPAGPAVATPGSAPCPPETTSPHRFA